MLGHQMDHIALPLDASPAGDHAGREDQASLLFEEGRPDDEICDVGFVLDGDEHDAFGRTRLLPHEHQPRNRHPLAVADPLKSLASHYPPGVEILPEEGDRMPAQRETLGSIIFHNLPALGHGRQTNVRLDGFRSEVPVAFVSRGEKRQRYVAEALDLPQRVAAVQSDGTEGIGFRQALESGHRYAGPPPDIV